MQGIRGECSGDGGGDIVHQEVPEEPIPCQQHHGHEAEDNREGRDQPKRVVEVAEEFGAGVGTQEGPDELDQGGLFVDAQGGPGLINKDEVDGEAQKMI